MIDELDFVDIERFVCVAYDVKERFKINDINKLRYIIFKMSSDNNLRKLPPTRYALKQHILRSAYTAGWIWGLTLEEDLIASSPVDWGWKLEKDGKYVPDWCVEPEKTLQDIIFTCSCKGACSRCKCAKKRFLACHFVPVTA